MSRNVQTSLDIGWPGPPPGFHSQYRLLMGGGVPFTVTGADGYACLARHSGGEDWTSILEGATEGQALQFWATCPADRTAVVVQVKNRHWRLVQGPAA